jgi:hypothetical protein
MKFPVDAIVFFQSVSSGIQSHCGSESVIPTIAGLKQLIPVNASA